MQKKLYNKPLENIYAIGDVHGCYHTLLKLVDQLPDDATLLFVGDLCDKGNFSRDVIEYVINGGHVCIKGNHEHLFEKHIMEAVQDDVVSLWSDDKRYGGRQTIESYHGDLELMHKHKKWIEQLPVYLEIENYFITHGFGLEFYDKRHDPKHYFSFLLNRLYDDHKEVRIQKDIINVFGHCAFDEIKQGDQHICIDTACVTEGKLTALQLGTHQVFEEPLDPKDSDYRLKLLKVSDIDMDAVTLDELHSITLDADCLYQEYDAVADEVLEAIVERFDRAGIEVVHGLRKRNVVLAKQLKKFLRRQERS